MELIGDSEQFARLHLRAEPLGLGIHMRRCLALVFALLLIASTTAAAETRPNILFCIADDWGWPHAGGYGDAVVRTPNFDRLAKEGLLCTNAYISSPSCTPSRNAILTGQHFWRLGTGANLRGELPETAVTYPELLAKAGYETGHWRKSYGPGKLQGRWLVNHPAGKNYQKGLPQFLDQLPAGKPFCFWLGASDPHRPYEPGSGAKSGLDLDKIKLFAHFPDTPTIRGDVADYYFEVNRFDSDVGKAVELLKERGLLDNTIIVVTGDHGMPFPRGKSNVYDSGARVPLVIRWGSKIQPGRVVDDFISTTDLAPTFLQAAGLPIPPEMTGKSLLPLLEEKSSGRLAPDERAYVLFGKERHTQAQEAPQSGGYPMRALRNHDFLLIHNLDPTRWPNGTPNYERAFVRGAWYADTDNGPTKADIIHNQDQDDAHRRAYELSFAKRPEWELYDMKKDPSQLQNVAADPAYAAPLKKLQDQLNADLRATGDPRSNGTAEFDSMSYIGGAPKYEAPGK